MFSKWSKSTKKKFQMQLWHRFVPSHFDILVSFSDIWILVLSILFATDTIGFHSFSIIYSTEVSGCFISLLISLYYLKTLFTETNLLQLIYGLIKIFQIRISIVFNLPFSKSTVLSCFSSFFFIIDLNFLNFCVDYKNFYS